MQSNSKNNMEKDNHFSHYRYATNMPKAAFNENRENNSNPMIAPDSATTDSSQERAKVLQEQIENLDWCISHLLFEYEKDNGETIDGMSILDCLVKLNDTKWELQGLLQQEKVKEKSPRNHTI